MLIAQFPFKETVVISALAWYFVHKRCHSRKHVNIKIEIAQGAKHNEYHLSGNNIE